MQYRAAFGFIPSFIISLIAIILAVNNNEFWLLALIISLFFQIPGIIYSKKYNDMKKDR